MLRLVKNDKKKMIKAYIAINLRLLIQPLINILRRSEQEGKGKG